MDPKEMIFSLPRYEIKDFNKNEWKRVPEKDFLIKLLDNYGPITPILSELFQGKTFIARDCIYRIQKF